MDRVSRLLKVSATGKWKFGVKTNLSIRNYPTFSMDESSELGGIDTLPTSLEYIVAALNGCSGIVILLVSKELDFTFSGIDFETTGIIYNPGLMGEEGVCTHFQKVCFQVDIQTEESEERIEQLKDEVERRCPVLNLLLDAGIKVDTKWIKKQIQSSQEVGPLQSLK
jgi:uncharacterized OsmC-like protein